MPNYRRWYVPGGTYFFTVVTHLRRPIMASECARKHLHDAIEELQDKQPFSLTAIVLLPDHLHTIWTLPANDSDYSGRWAVIKESFTRRFLRDGGADGPRSASRVAKRERGVWQRRFWEHVCHHEQDFKNHLDYLHWNPVKHGLVRCVRDWPWSSFHRYVELGEYEPTWGSLDPCPEMASPAWEIN